MKMLTVRRKIRFPIFGIWKWKKADYGTPIALNTSNGKALIFVDERPFTSVIDVLEHFPSGHIELLFTPPPANLLRGLKSKGQLAQRAARIIYDSYVDAYRQFQALLMSAGGVRMLLGTGSEGMEEFFDPPAIGEAVEWKVDEEEYQLFKVKIPRERGRHPLYTAQQLVSPSRWEKMQRAADNSEIPNDELLELYNTRSKAEWKQQRVAAIEASIISETLLREYALKILKSEGFSNTKIKRLKDELSFNNLLNIVLPLSLNKTELRRIGSSIQAVDTLRAIRNDLVHGTATLQDIDEGKIGRGIDGAIKLVGFLKVKLQSE